MLKEKKSLNKENLKKLIGKQIVKVDYEKNYGGIYTLIFSDNSSVSFSCTGDIMSFTTMNYTELGKKEINKKANKKRIYKKIYALYLDESEIDFLIKLLETAQDDLPEYNYEDYLYDQCEELITDLNKLKEEQG